jgi:sporulation protein YlmC with PRC-barrel domain
MRKTLSKMTALCAAGSIMAVSAWAQTESVNQPVNNSSSVQNNRSWSTKHLSATGRNNDYPVRASKLTGAQVSDSSGRRVGQIQDVIVNPASGRIEFALISVNSGGSAPSSATASQNNAANDNSSGNLVPVPWSLLRTSASSQYSGANSEQPVFTLNADQSKLSGAPKVDWSDLSQSEWQQRIYAYYGVSPESPIVSPQSPQGEIKSPGPGQLQQSTPERPQQLTP